MPSRQTAIHSGFGAVSTAEEVIRGVDLTGKVAIVTGGYSGIGRETTRVLAEAGATVVVPVRDAEKARRTLDGIPRVELRPMDLLDPQSMDAFAAAFLDSGRPLHILVNSAGVMANPLARDARGYESQFATNHLGHFHLTARLWPALVRAQGARVVSVSSRGHQFSPVHLDDANFERRPYDKWQAYGQSKSANVLFAVELDRRGESKGVRAFALHPGAIATDLGRYLTAEDLRSFGITSDLKPGSVPLGQSVAEGGEFKTVEQGAATSVWCATSPQLAGMGGVYCENSDVAPVIQGEPPQKSGVAPWAVDAEIAKRLWPLSEELTGVPFAA
ncbi:MAG TPA: oxidoreductase [Bryobacteraceae bacterium]|jgi:NAD(P)-dependent dehydrogenase (short-subunit alcohol dehydrogenase family)|nr:oxidoreductase [Bryobacteraceae bacterium]